MVTGRDSEAGGGPEPRQTSTHGRLDRSWSAILDGDVQFLPALLSPFWIIGLMLSSVAIVFIALGGPDGVLSRKLFDWSLYVALGGSFALATLLAYVLREQAWSTPWARRFYLTLSTAAFLGLAGLVIQDRWIALPLALLQTAWTIWILRHQQPRSAREFALMAIVTILGWIAVAPLMWWETLPDRIWRMPLGLPVVVLAVIGVTSWAMAPAPDVREPSRVAPLLSRGIDVLAVAVIGVLALRTDGLFLAGEPWGSLHHWGVFVGPAQEVRDGGFLLWDVPAQYGFLSTLLLAATPVQSLWQALYLWNGLSLFVTAIAVYAVIRAVRPDWVGRIVALAAAVAGTFLAATWAETLSPIHYHPSFGPFRYVWCYALIAAVALAVRQLSGSRSEAGALVVGNICWLLGVYWSFESAVFCSAIWFSAYLPIVAGRAGLLPSRLSPPPTTGPIPNIGVPTEDRAASPSSGLRGLFVWFVAPLAMLAVALAVTGLVYARDLGRLPDFWSYVEYVMSFGSGYVSEIAGETVVLDPTDAHLAIALTLVVVFGSLAVLARTRLGAPTTPLLVATGVAVWFVSSYSIGRPHPHTVSRSWPFLLLAVGIALVLLGSRADWRSSLTVRSASVPLVAMLLVLTYTNLTELHWHVTSLELPGQRLVQVEEGLPVADERLASLLTEAGLTADAPVIFDGSAGGNIMPMWYAAPNDNAVTLSRSWVPAPLTGLIVLDEERRQKYMERMIDRRRSGGWYVHRANDKDFRNEKRWAGSGQWFFDQLAKTHVPTRSYQNEDWQIVWFDYVGDSPEVARPQIVGGQLHESPDQLWIDRRSINSGRDFGIWMIPADGWSNDGSTRRLSLSFPATASIYSDRDRDVTVKLTSGKRSRIPEFDVEQNGAAVGSVRRSRGSAGLFDLSLREGWNEFVLRMPAGAGENGEQTADPSPIIEIERIDVLTRGEQPG